MKQQTIFTTRNTVKYFTNVTLPGGRNIPIRFEPRLYIGTLGVSQFSSADDDVVSALKKHPYFGTTFFVESEPTKTAVVHSDGSTTSVAGITNTQAAVEWLASNHEHKFSGRPSKDEVITAAASYNVVFTDWK